MLYRKQNILLQMAVVVCMGVIGGMVYYTYTHIQDTQTELRRDLSDKTGDIKGSIDVLDDKVENIDMTCPQGKACPSCPQSTCPSAEEIATAVFPGRNTGLTSGGKYFDIKSSGSYELLPEHDFFKPEEAFPVDSLLDPPLRDANVPVTQNQIDNSTGSFNVDTQRAASRSASQTRMDDRNLSTRNLDARMNQGITDKDRLKKDLARATESKAPASSRLVDSAQTPETDNEKDMRLNMSTRYNLFGTKAGKLYE
jgi:hypothetical protein